jgi:hypothetical protein
LRLTHHIIYHNGLDGGKLQYQVLENMLIL